GQQAQADADVDEGLHAQPQHHALGDQAIEDPLQHHGLAGDVEAPHHDIDENADQAQDAGQAELLADDGDDEVGVRLGQVMQLLDAGAQTDAEPLSPPQGDQ